MTDRKFTTGLGKRAGGSGSRRAGANGAHLYPSAPGRFEAFGWRQKPRSRSGGVCGIRSQARGAVHKARVAILTTSAPMHINALTEAIGGDSSREGRVSLASSLAAYVRKGEIFTLPAPNTFGLVELGHKTIPDEDDRPPAGFGQTVPQIATWQSPNPHAASFGRSAKSATSAPEPEAPSEEIDDLHS